MMRLTLSEARAAGLKPIRRSTRKIPWNRQGRVTVGDTGRDKAFDAACIAHGLPVPVHEYPWHPTRKFLADYCFDGWLLVEKDGGLFGRGPQCPTCHRSAVGAHSSIKQMMADRIKDREAAIHGFTVVRFFPSEFDDGSAFTWIAKLLKGEFDEA